MKTAMTLMLLLAFCAATADPVEVFKMGAFEQGALVFLAADTVNVRNGPGTAATVLDNLPVGYQVTVLKKTDRYFSVNGLKAPWYQVSYTTGAGARTGYIWGGFISLAALPVQYAGKPALIILGIKSAGNNGEIPVHAMIASDGKIVSEIKFEAIGLLDGDRTYNYSVSAQLHGSRGFTGISNIIEVTFNYPACGYPFGSVLLMYDGKQVTYGTRAISMVEGGIFHDITKFVFPDEKGGVTNSIVSVETIENFDEKKQTYVHGKTVRKIHAWDGAAFTDAR